MTGGGGGEPVYSSGVQHWSMQDYTVVLWYLSVPTGQSECQHHKLNDITTICPTACQIHHSSNVTPPPLPAPQSQQDAPQPGDSGQPGGDEDGDCSSTS